MRFAAARDSFAARDEDLVGVGMAMVDGKSWHVRPVGRTAWAVWAGDLQLPAGVFPSAEQAVTWARRQADPARHGRVLVHERDASVSEEILLGDYPHLPD